MSTHQDPSSPVGGRKEMGDSESSRRDPPHVTENDEGADYQAETPERGTAAALPANASGSDKVSTADQPREVDEASMYDRRPSQDKDRPPSSGAG